MAEQVPIDKELPVIDLAQANGERRALVVQQLLKAFEEYGLFQVINHGISEKLMDEAEKVYQEFFSLPEEDKAKYAKGTSDYLGGLVKLYDQKNKGIWRDALQHSCNAGDEYVKNWPDNPPRYREVIRKYCDEVRKLSKVILSLVSEALGLEAGYFEKQLGRMTLFGMNYPACPDPSSTFGLGGHCDPNLITLIQQDVYGLQIMKDGEWIGVEPLPHAFVVNSGLALTVISNGKIAAVVHRVVANATQPRTSIGTFINPEHVVEPEKSLLGPCNPPLFKSFNWLTEFIPHHSGNRSSYQATLDPFKINA